MDRKTEDWVEILEYFITRYPLTSYRPIDVSIVQDNRQEEYLMKIILIGDGAVGKTSIRERYLGHGFTGEYLPTLGADFTIAREAIRAKKIRFQVWDLAGQPKFKNVRRMYYGGAQAAFVVCDVTNQESVINIVKWVSELWKQNGRGPIPFVILGNKIDLRPTEEDCVDDLSLQRMAEGISSVTFANFRFRISYLPTSAKTGENITKAFQQIALQVITHRRYLRKFLPEVATFVSSKNQII